MTSWLPSNSLPWPVSRVGHHFAVTLGKMVNAAKIAEGAVDAPYLAAGNIQPDSLVFRNPKSMPFLPEELQQYSLEAGDVVVVEGGAGYGRSQLLKRDLPGWGFQNHVARVRPHGARGVVPDFLLYSLRACLSSGFIEANNRTATLPSLSRDVLSSLALPVPPVGVQREIVDYLDHETAQIDTLIAEQKRLIGLLHERRTASLQQHLNEGETVPVRRVITRLRQGWSPNCEATPADGVTEWGVLKVGCGNRGSFDPTENKRLPDDVSPRVEHAIRAGEVVMSRSNTKELVGAAAVVPPGFPRLLLSDLNYALTPADHVGGAFLSFALNAPQTRAQVALASKGSSPSMQKISQRDVLELTVRIPDRAKQDAAVERIHRDLRAIELMTKECSTLIELARERRSALITAAVTGQIEIPEAS